MLFPNTQNNLLLKTAAGESMVRWVVPDAPEAVWVLVVPPALWDHGDF